MSGSKGARASPDLIAACHVFHRLSMPRHPSEALMRLIVLSKTHAWGRYMSLGGTKRQTTPTHALCFLMSSRARPPSFRGSRTDPSFTMSNHGARRRRGNLSFPIARFGGARRNRTDDLMLAKHALYQLSYGPSLEVASPARSRHRSVVRRPRVTQWKKCGGPRQTRTADLTLIRRVL